MSLSTHLRRGSKLWLDGAFWSCFFKEQTSTGSRDPLIGLRRVPLCKHPEGKPITYRFLSELLDLEIFGLAILVMETPDSSLPSAKAGMPISPGDASYVVEAALAETRSAVSCPGRVAPAGAA